MFSLSNKVSEKFYKWEEPYRILKLKMFFETKCFNFNRIFLEGWKFNEKLKSWVLNQIKSWQSWTFLLSFRLQWFIFSLASFGKRFFCLFYFCEKFQTFGQHVYFYLLSISGGINLLLLRSSWTKIQF